MGKQILEFAVAEFDTTSSRYRYDLKSPHFLALK